MKEEKDSSLVVISFRLPKRIAKLYDALHPYGANAAIKELAEEAILTPEWLQAKIEQYHGIIAQLKKLNEISPLVQDTPFSKEENEWFKGHYDSAITTFKQDPSFMRERIYKGYNLLTNNRLSKKQFQKVLDKWLHKNNLQLPG